MKVRIPRALAPSYRHHNLPSNLSVLFPAVSQPVRLSYIALYSISRKLSLSSSPSLSSNHRSDLSGQGYSNVYEAGKPVSGPIGATSDIGIPKFTPKSLKRHLDQYVVGQEKAKKDLCIAIYNHHLRIEDKRRQEEAEAELLAKQWRKERGHQDPQLEEDNESKDPPTVMYYPPGSPKNHSSSTLRLKLTPSQPESQLLLEKSNILMLGPSGTGKTLMANTLAKVLNIPIVIVDVTPFTQAGYIGPDADECVARLLAAADYDVTSAERGIICLDETDKIATAKVSHGKDVSGEGVQQAFLKIIEGTTLQIPAKQERGAPRPNSNNHSASINSQFPSNWPGGGSTTENTGIQKGDVFRVRTDNILFIAMGAFVGLDKIVMDRVSKGSMGFENTIVSKPSDGTISLAPYPALAPAESSPINQPQEQPSNIQFYEHSSKITEPIQPPLDDDSDVFNPLDLVTPADLQKFGLIPELVGRLPVTTPLHALRHSHLVSILTEPRNSVVAQFTHLFSLSNMELRFTQGALSTIAYNAMKNGTGARGLRTEMEKVLKKAQFEGPGSGIRYVGVTEKAVRGEEDVIYASRGQEVKFREMLEGKNGNGPKDFVEYRKKVSAGFG
ncbi:MAG: hypothetical protein M1834_001808 [Cirrosporium novae-zelandiae]|nr:MAG: hypothetical protein M1834_001808 [Cirrosporium novae-zelandiae]